MQREAGKSIWECSEERAKFLKEHNAVEILEKEKEVDTFENFEKELKEVENIIDYDIEEKPKVIFKSNKKKKTSKK